MRLDHLLSKEKSKGDCCSIMSVLAGNRKNRTSGGDALRGDTRTHPEHES